jgi:TonB family protein
MSTKRRSGCPPDSGHSRPDLWVAFEGRGERTRVELSPESGVASFEKRDALRGSLLLLDRAKNVRKLLMETFPGKPKLVSIEWCATEAPDTGASRPSASQEVRVAEPSLRVPAEYPEDARNSGVDGTVWIEVLVGADGLPKETCIRKSITMLDESAVRCIEQWQFRPAKVDGVPTASWVVLPIRFTLH